MHVTYEPSALSSENIITRFFGGIAPFLVMMAEANPRLRQAEALAALSDAELAERGLKREDIARQVFGDWL